MYKKKKPKSVEDLKHYLQEAEIVRNCTRVALKDPSLEPERRSEYEIACMRLNAEIRDLKTRLKDVRRGAYYYEAT
ncbi:MAG TPA: hypothetical protein VLZ07_10070 [Syntrophales bacterium]|nr:hypothetical protein [Syntrophales bacterium]